MQLRYLGMYLTDLTGDALEWYCHEVEHYARSTHKWTLESTLVRLQSHFVHLLANNNVSIQFTTAQQGSGTVKDLLNSLTKFMARMVQYPDKYTL